MKKNKGVNKLQWWEDILNKDESELPGKILMATCFNEVEDYDEKREPTRWKVSTRKLYEFVSTLLQEEQKRIREELLEKGHGGGNWRRLIIQILGDN